MRIVPAAEPLLRELPLELANLLASRRPVLDVQLGDGDIALALDREAMIEEPRRCFSLATEPGRIWLEMAEGWIEDRLPPDTALPPIESLSPQLVAAVIDIAVTPICRSLTALFGMPIGAASYVEAVPAGLIRLSLQETGESATATRLILAMDDTATDSLTEALHRLPPDASATIAEEVPIRLHALAGSRRLTLSEAQALALGAVVLLAGAGPDEGVGLAAGPGFRPVGRGQLEGGAIIIEAIGDLAMAADPTAPDDVEIDPDVATAIEDLEVRLDFVLGHATLRVADLREIAPGSTLTLDGASVDQEVAIYASGKRLGTGELVKIGDLMGVRLVSLTGRADG
ncbi:MAG: type III secretion system cytoplasmic ring protein SctQ [Pseudomonadota bacterium]